MAAPELMSTVIHEVAEVVSRLAGIQLGAQQHAMIQRRIHSRMLRLGLASADDYMKYLRSNMQKESQELVSLLTTHHTFFFREQVHFDFIETQLLDGLIERARSRPDKTLRIWSAASSTGQEAYTLAMFFDHHLGRKAPDVRFEILGTDVDPASTATATNGVYHKRELNRVPLAYMGSHWAKGRGEIAEFVKAKDSLRRRVRFQPMNLLGRDRLRHTIKFDVIFCRNVFIYFNESQIEDCVKYLLSQLDEDGRIFLGVSESMVTLSNGVEGYGHAIFGHRRVAPMAVVPTPSVRVPVEAPAKPAALVAARPLRVLCVDDSKSILGLLARVLTRGEGFEIVATAQNGVEAAAKLKDHEVDLVTLDIHMPEMDGVSYLAHHFGPGHPPVVIVSSVSREDAGLAVRALQLGAADYIEKPTLANFAEASEEIRMKLKAAAATAALPVAKDRTSLDEEFAKRPKLKVTDGMLGILFSSVAQIKQIGRLLSQMEGLFPPVVVVVEGAGNVAEELVRSIQVPAGLRSAAFQANASLLPGTIYVTSDVAAVRRLAGRPDAGKTCVMVLGIPGASAVDAVLSFKDSCLLVEDLQGIGSSHHKRLASAAREVVPLTSFVYSASRFFGDG